MARNLNALFLALLAVATLFNGSAAQTRHVVGDATGWTIPSGGASTYVNWAANKTFTVGDTLVFNFANGQHNVARVTKSGFDACNGGSALSTLTSSPATVTLNETGQQYFICTFGGHCSLGQKLSINVVKASTSPVSAPQPSPSGSPPPKPTPSSAPAPAPAPTTTTTPPPTTSPTSSPSPSPSTGPVTYTVGDTSGWIIPSNGGGATFYRNWASGKTFKVGDILVFNYALNAHNVEEVTKEKFDSCSSNSPIATYTNPPVRVTLNKSGSHYFICGITGHCSAGQKLSINVVGSSTATPPSSTATPPSGSTSSPPPSSTINPSSPSPSGSASPPPQNSGAASLGTVGFFATLLSIAAAIFY